MINRVHTNKEAIKGHEVAIVVKDDVDEGHPIITLDIIIDGKSVGEGEVDYEEMYSDVEYMDQPQSIRFLHVVMSSVGSLIK